MLQVDYLVGGRDSSYKFSWFQLALFDRILVFRQFFAISVRQKSSFEVAHPDHMGARPKPG